ncbi:hypothetical protein Tsubulata_042397 [Turnera subulata]|uniref:Uncharacterized protein n=1 Tax=Turnera subulata TaxID=218843 RepID=A0A9Q0G2H7_9ROSI|nr:hypothetical protein Tsubulata_042397 [Turnera subulata]
MSTTKAAYHVRSTSLPSRSHPLTVAVEAQLDRLRSSQATSSSASHKLGDLKDLLDGTDALLQLPISRQALSNGCMDCLLDGSLQLLDACSSTKDTLSQLRDCLKELQSSFRRKRGGESCLSSDIEAYRVSRKNLRQAIVKILRNLKAMDKNNTLDSSSSVISSMLKEVEQVCTSVFASILSSISPSMEKSRQGGWSIVSRLLHSKPKRVSPQVEVEANEVVNMDAELFALKSSKEITSEQVQNALKGLQSLESSIQEVEEELECVYRRLLKAKVSLLNILNH